MSDQPNMELVDKAVEQLGEHFDAVQIFVIKNEGYRRSTFAASRQCGCIYTRYGYVREWLLTVDEQTRRAAPVSAEDSGDKTTGELT